jgi:hypothetical protein
MTDSVRADKYKKDADQERALWQMNETLAQFEGQLAPRVNAPEHPLLFIVGYWHPRDCSPTLATLWRDFGLLPG